MVVYRNLSSSSKILMVLSVFSLFKDIACINGKEVLLINLGNSKAVTL